MPGMIASALIGELTHEAGTTRKLLARVPIAKRDFSPHPKSWPLHRLASHVAQLVLWTAVTCETTELDMAGPFPSPEWATTDDLVAHFDGYVAHALKALGATSDADMMTPWTLKNGSAVYFTMPKIQVLRSMCFNHHVHHRGQLSIYLRLNDVPLPNMYGPTADEQ